MITADINTTEYPFQSHTIEIEGCRIHYVDEGKGTVVLLLHGIPDWSFSYREVIRELSETHRVIAPDNLGFGLSDAPADADYSPQAHARRLEKLIEKLGLRDINLFVHDLAGPFGLAYAISHPNNIKSIGLANTFMWPLDDNPQMVKGGKLISSGLGRFLYLKINFSVNFMVPQSFGDKKKLTREVHRHYKLAQKKPGNRRATYISARSLLAESAWYDGLWNKRDVLKDKPILILWGMKDRFFPHQVFLKQWKDAFPGARVVELDKAGHFIQEEAPHEMAAELKKL